jgi:methionyl-tRNA formyltransferase
MRIVFIGAVEFSLCALEKLLSLDVEIVGVCTLRTSKFNADHIDLSKISNKNAIPFFYADDINSTEALIWIKSKNPDIIFCFGWSNLLKQELLELAPMGVVGFHPAALPANRGRHPIIWALVLGLDKTASTFFFMNKDADSGDIISQREVLIAEQDTARTLYDKVVETAMSQLAEFIPLLAKGAIQAVKQNHMHQNEWRKRNDKDGVIDWRMSAQSIHNLVRALSKPYIGAHFILHGKEVKVWRASIYDEIERNLEPGKILQISINGPIIKCGQSAICLIETEPKINLKVGNYL